MTMQNPFGMGLDVMRQLGTSQAQIAQTQGERQRQQMLQQQAAEQAALAEEQAMLQQQKDLFNLLGNLRQLPDVQSRMQAIQASPFAQVEGIGQLMNEQALSDEGLTQIIAASPFAQEKEDTSTRFGTVNPRDYTPQSLAKYAETGNFADLERYYPLKQTEVGGIKYFADDQGNLFLPVTQDVTGQTVPATPAEVESGDATPSAVPVGTMTPEQQMASEAQAAAEKAAAVEAAKAEQQAESPEAQEMRRLKEQELDRTKSLIDKLLKSDDLGKISGAETGIPLLGSVQSLFAQDALNDLKSLTNLLTMGNLGRMSGVLSESDIKLIANAASGIGMNDQGTPISEERLREILSEIKNRLDNPTADGQKNGGGSGNQVVNWADLPGDQ